MRTTHGGWVLAPALAALWGAPQAALAAEGPARPIEIHFGPRTSPPETAAARKARLAEAERRAKEAEKQLRAQYGKEESEWPPEKSMELLKLQAGALDTSGEYEKASAQDVRDSIQDLKTAAAGKAGDGLLNAVPSQEEAHLAVEVLGRYAEKPADVIPGFPRKYGLLLRVAPGGKLDVARLERLHVFWVNSWGGAFVQERHRFSAAEPYWTLEVTAPLRWTEAANAAVSLLAEFPRKSPDLFAPRKE